MATTSTYGELSNEENFVGRNILLAMQHIFALSDINRLDIADGLKQLLHKKKYDLNYVLQSNMASLADELGIEEYVAKLIIDAAKKISSI